MQGQRPQMASKQASEKPKSPRVFGQARKPSKMFRAGLYARVSTNDQQTIPLQMRALREYAESTHLQWDGLLEAARRREVQDPVLGQEPERLGNLAVQAGHGHILFGIAADHVADVGHSSV